MPTTNRVINLTAEPIWTTGSSNELVDILIQNLSANNIYVGSGQNVDVTTGLKIITNGVYTNDKRKDPIWCISDVAGSDIRVVMEVYKAGSR